MFTIESAAVVSELEGLRLSHGSSDRALSYRSDRMPLCFANAIQVGAQVLAGRSSNEISACYLFTHWGAAALARECYEQIENSSSGLVLPLMFQNTTNAVALGQFAIELGLRCPMYTLSAPPSQIIRTALQLLQASGFSETSETYPVAMVAASDEAPSWLGQAAKLSRPALADRQFTSCAAAIVLRPGRGRGGWFIRGVEETRHLELTGAALDLIASSTAGVTEVPDVYVLGESEVNVQRTLSNARINTGRIFQLGLVEASSANSLTALAMACGRAPHILPTRRLICVRGLDDCFCWISIETA